jgi:hypothetical protein
MNKKIFVFLMLLFSFFSLFSQEANYDESKVPEYTLPPLLRLKNGKPVKSSRVWMKKRRPEIVADFENLMYGVIPGELHIAETEILEHPEPVFQGKAQRRQVRLIFQHQDKELRIHVLLYLPKSQEPVPVFLGLNFLGNQTLCDDPGILLAESWIINNEMLGITDHRATEQSRGGKAYRWEVENWLDAGFGVATACCGDIDPDRDDFSDGPHPFLYENGQDKPAAEEWGTLAAWSWGLSRIMDYLETVAEVDAEKVVLTGHSRLGKAALWAGALDQRFAAVISNNSGCGGAALSRRAFGETVERINRVFPHWFCDNFKKYNNQEATLPVDQHMLIALMAPRPVYIASASEDLWADPKGEYLSGYYASEVYRLFTLKGLDHPEQPPVNKPMIQNGVSYHIRNGEHDVKAFDLEQYRTFAKRVVQ